MVLHDLLCVTMLWLWDKFIPCHSSQSFVRAVWTLTQPLQENSVWTPTLTRSGCSWENTKSPLKTLSWDPVRWKSDTVIASVEKEMCKQGGGRRVKHQRSVLFWPKSHGNVQMDPCKHSTPMRTTLQLRKGSCLPWDGVTGGKTMKMWVYMKVGISNSEVEPELFHNVHRFLRSERWWM
jgi:hypothetical protein